MGRWTQRRRRPGVDGDEGDRHDAGADAVDPEHDYGVDGEMSEVIKARKQEVKRKSLDEKRNMA